VTVRATQRGDAVFAAAPPTNVTFGVAKAAQSITSPTLADRTASDPPFGIGATSSSGLPVLFSVSGPATLNSSNVMSILGSGTVSVLAYQPGNSNFSAAIPVQRSFNVSKVPQTISFGPLSEQRVGDAPFALVASASSGLRVSFLVLSGPA